MDPGKIYSESLATYRDQSASIITVSSPVGVSDVVEERYAIDPSTGALLYWSIQGAAYETTFETDMDIPHSMFAVPDGKIVTDSQDPNRDRGYLFNADQPQPTPTH
jgi:hypothetical protein